MGFLKGSASFVRFSVEGELPENPLYFIADRVVSFCFRDIDVFIFAPLGCFFPHHAAEFSQTWDL